MSAHPRRYSANGVYGYTRLDEEDYAAYLPKHDLSIYRGNGGMRSFRRARNLAKKVKPDA